MNPKYTVPIVLLVGVITAWGLNKFKHSTHEPLLFYSNTAAGLLNSGEGRIRQPGSWSVIASRPVILRVYMIDDGKKALKETIRFEPKDRPAIYFTVCETYEEGSALIISDHPSAERKRIYRVIQFSPPISIGSGNESGPVDPQRPGLEVLCFKFSLARSDRGSPVVNSFAEMLSQSQSEDQKCSYIAVTCEEM